MDRNEMCKKYRLSYPINPELSWDELYQSNHYQTAVLVDFTNMLFSGDMNPDQFEKLFPTVAKFLSN
jgi:hypothetical protein